MKSHLLDGAPDSFTLVPEDIHEAFERLSRTEARLLAFLCRYTFGEDKLWVRVTFDEFEHGLKRPNGTRRTAVTGQSAYRINKALEADGIKWAAIPSMNWRRATRLREDQVCESVERLRLLGFVRVWQVGQSLYVSRDEGSIKKAVLEGMDDGE